MKIVVVTGSPHKAGTSALLADKFIEGAQSKGHDVFRFNAAFEDIHPCRGCDACGMNGPCVQKDAIEEKLIHKLVECDMIVLVTPLYYFGFSAQLKTVIDRFYSRTGSIHKKKSALLATAWNNDSWTRYRMPSLQLMRSFRHSKPWKPQSRARIRRSITLINTGMSRCRPQKRKPMRSFRRRKRQRQPALRKQRARHPDSRDRKSVV